MTDLGLKDIVRKVIKKKQKYDTYKNGIAHSMKQTSTE